MIGIYKITNPSGSVYIGQSVNIGERMKGYKRTKAIGQPALHASILKHGFDSHSICVIQPYLKIDHNLLNIAEKVFIKNYRDRGFKVLNISDGGKRTPCPKSDDWKKKLSLRQLGIPRGVGEANCKNKLTSEQVLSIRKEYIPEVITMKILSKKYGVSHGTINFIIQRQTWKHL